ncbi:hypothetical protein MKW94_029084 [Papaver nudicaule]|uniref:Uncharacterized protein n=1 Tax=Papaver nudicaule TaxID=74823 RepID=A0AA41RU45_PAPNU|nr:hypothetical protein [Papaver nudicaule]
MNLAKKAVGSLRYIAFNQHLRSNLEEFRVITEEFTKVTAEPNLKNILSSTEEAKHVHEVAQHFDKSLINLVERCKHFKEHELPNLLACKMFRDSVSPSVATTMAGALLGAFLYKRHLKKRDQGLDKELSAETAKELQGQLL